MTFFTSRYLTKYKINRFENQTRIAKMFTGNMENSDYKLIWLFHFDVRFDEI